MTKNDMKRIAEKICEMIYAKDRRRPEPYDTTAEVRRVENGKAYVHLPGGIDETPVELTIDAAAGDTVQVRVANGSAWLVGNQTAPPTDDTTARKAQKTADRSETDAKKAEITAEEAAETAKNTAQHFWHKNGTDSEAGAHVTEVPADEFMQNPSGGNILMRSNSLKLRMALVTLAELTGTAFTFYDPTTHQERLTINADGIYLKGKLITGTYSYARLQAEYFLIAYYNGNRHITSEYFGKGGFGNYLFSRKQIATVGSHPVFSSTVIDEDGVKIIHDDSDTPYDTPMTGSFKKTLANLEDDTLLLQNVDNYGNEYQTVEVSAEDGGGIVITAKDGDGNQNEIFKLEGTYDTADASNSYADMTLSGELTANGKATFGAIDNGLFAMTTHELSVSANSTGNYDATVNVTKSGYYPLGIVGYIVSTTGAYSRGAYMSNVASGSCTAHVRIYASSTGTKSCTAYILWVKTTA